MTTLKQPLKRPQIISFLAILAVLTILVFFILKPFLSILALAIIVAILFQPVYGFILKHTQSPSWSSLFTILVLLIIILGPVLFFGQIVLKELTHLYNQIRDGSLVINPDQVAQNIPPQFKSVIYQISQNISNIADSISSNAFAFVSSLASNVFGFFLGAFLFLCSTFFLLRDGDKLIAMLKNISPIDSGQEKILSDRIISAVNGVIKGQFLVALIQGVVATIGMIIFGVPSPVILGILVVIASLVPNLGTSLVMVPVIIYLFVIGETNTAIGLLIWSVIAVGGIDNLISPKLVGSQLKLHPLLVLLAVVGGLEFFGILGFLIGPILMAVFVQMIDMYRTDLKQYIHI